MDLTGIKPQLTRIAALGLVVIMIGATVTNIANGVPAFAIPTAVLGVMAGVVAYGRRPAASGNIPVTANR